MKLRLPSSVSMLKQLLAFLVTLTIFGCTRGSVRCIERERLALLDFKKSFVSFDSNDKLSSWKSSEKDCCTWDGITCDDHTRYVISLDLSDQSLGSNQLRPSLLQLHHLRSLNLSSNYFATGIPKFIGSFSGLKYLDLFYAGFSGKIPSHLGNLSSIQVLNLGANGLSSDNFYWLSHLSSLKHLDLSSTNFTKARDWLSTIRKLPLLSSFSCSGCFLPPPAFSSAPSHQVNSSMLLKTLDLSDNILYSSTISWLINSTNNLSELHLRGYLNSEGPFPNLCVNMTSLEWLSHLPSLRALDLNYANFSHARDWLSTIRKLPLLASFQCEECSFPSPTLSFSPHHVNYSTSLKIVDLSYSSLSSSTIFSFLNNSSNLSVLDLSYLNLEGLFPDLFQNMISLKTLDLSGAQLASGIFKSIGNICNLEELNAYACGLNQSLANVLQDLTSCASSSLQLLYMSSNNLTGTIPPMLSFGSLTWLYLDENNLDSFQLQNSTFLPNLHVSDISSSKFSNGSLRNTLRLFPASLTSLSLSYNSLTGVFSEAHFTNFSNLLDLDLSNNPNLTIRFSKPPPQLESIFLGSCKLGPTFPGWLLAQNNFSSLDISNSAISDSIPFSFWRNLPSSLRSLNLSHNNLHGTVPNLQFSFFKFLSVVDLSSNAFYGIIPFSLFKATILLLSKNNFLGFAPLPHSYNFSKFSDVSSTVLDFSDNSLSGAMPDWLWSLIYKSKALNLANNYLSGTIPESIGNASHLQVLSLSNNSFFGTLPLWLKNCSNLSILDLSWNRFSGLIPIWMGDELKNLAFLSLKSNNLTGSIPLSICHLKFLHVLDLSYNNLSGNIPSSVHKFTAMSRDDDDWNFRVITVIHKNRRVYFGSRLEEYFFYLLVNWKGMDRKFQEILQFVKLIDLSNNNLSGEIPNGMTSLLGLKSLDLSGNNIHGNIPEEIGQLKSLEAVNLSYNRLSGHIPSSLASISSLEILNFSHNLLSGRIPTSTQLQSFSASAFADNKGLCGLPLSIKCPGDGEDPVEAPQPSATEGGDKWPDKECFYAGLGTGFAFGFLMILGTLTLIRKWRYALYRSAGDFANWILVHVELSISRVSRKHGLNR